MNVREVQQFDQDLLCSVLIIILRKNKAINNWNWCYKST